MSNHLVGLTEIAEMLGLSRQRADQITRTYPDFPEPEVELASGRVWRRSAVEDWNRRHPDRGATPGWCEVEGPVDLVLTAIAERV